MMLSRSASAIASSRYLTCPFDTLAGDLRQFAASRPVAVGSLTQINPARRAARMFWSPLAAKEASMHKPAWMIPSIAVLVVGALSAPAMAQTYDPYYPVCLQTYGINGTS